MYLIFSGNYGCQVMGGMEHAEVVYTCILEPNCCMLQDSIVSKQLQK